jgi:hypothetical protein
MDVYLSAYDRVIGSAVNYKLLKLSTSPHTDLLRQDCLLHTRDLASANRFYLHVDEKFGGKTCNSHEEDHMFRQFIPGESPAHAYHTFFLHNIPAVTREILPEVVASTRFASYPVRCSSSPTAFYNGASPCQLVLDCYLTNWLKYRSQKTGI